MEKQKILEKIDFITYDVASKVRFISEFFRGLSESDSNMASCYDGGEKICSEVVDQVCEITELTTRLEKLG